MGGLGHCLAGVLPALGQVWDVIVRPQSGTVGGKNYRSASSNQHVNVASVIFAAYCLGLRFRRVLEDMSMSRLPSLLIAVLSLLLSAVVACSRACS